MWIFLTNRVRIDLLSDNLTRLVFRLCIQGNLVP
nr:MAG TPA: hypothetical protein [Caudoviricetes sp.]